MLIEAPTLHFGRLHLGYSRLCTVTLWLGPPWSLSRHPGLLHSSLSGSFCHPRLRSLTSLASAKAAFSPTWHIRRLPKVMIWQSLQSPDTYYTATCGACGQVSWAPCCALSSGPSLRRSGCVPRRHESCERPDFIAKSTAAGHTLTVPPATGIPEPFQLLLPFPEGPGTQYLRTLVPQNLPLMVFWT